MTELTRTPPVLQRLFQTVDLAPLPHSEIIADAVAMWKLCRAEREYPDFGELIDKLSRRGREHVLLAFPSEDRDDFRIAWIGYHATETLQLPSLEDRLSAIGIPRLAARLRRLFRYALDIRELVDVRFDDAGLHFEVFAAPVNDRVGKVGIFCAIAPGDRTNFR